MRIALALLFIALTLPFPADARGRCGTYRPVVIYRPVIYRTVFYRPYRYDPWYYRRDEYRPRIAETPAVDRRSLEALDGEVEQVSFSFIQVKSAESSTRFMLTSNSRKPGNLEPGAKVRVLFDKSTAGMPHAVEVLPLP